MYIWFSILVYSIPIKRALTIIICGTEKKKKHLAPLSVDVVFYDRTT